MNKQDFLNAMNRLDERFITEAEQLAKPLHQDKETETEWIEIPLERVSRMEVKPNRRKRIAAGITAAAAFCGIVAGSIYWMHTQHELPNADSQTGKTDKSSQSGYVNIESEKEAVQQGQHILGVSSNGFTVDNKSFGIMTMDYTIDDNFLYGASHFRYKIELSTGKVQPDCNIVGCPHDVNTPGNCEAHLDCNSPVATTEGLYYNRGNQLICKRDGEEQVLLTNSYGTDFEKEMYPENQHCIGGIMIREDLIYLCGPSYFFTYNRKTGEIGDRKKISDSILQGMTATEEYLYFCNANMELLQYDLQTDSIQKIDDYVGQVTASDEKLYYIRWEENVPILYTANADGSNPKKLITNCYVNYCLTDTHIYYQSYAEKRQLFVCRLDGSEVQIIDFTNDGIYPNELMHIISSDAVDHVFIIKEDEPMKVAYVLPKGSAEYKMLEIDIS